MVVQGLVRCKPSVFRAHAFSHSVPIDPSSKDKSHENTVRALPIVISPIAIASRALELYCVETQRSNGCFLVNWFSGSTTTPCAAQEVPGKFLSPPV